MPRTTLRGVHLPFYAADALLHRMQPGATFVPTCLQLSDKPVPRSIHLAHTTSAQPPERMHNSRHTHAKKQAQRMQKTGKKTT